MAALNRLTAMIRPTSPVPSARMPLMKAILPALVSVLPSCHPAAARFHWAGACRSDPRRNSVTAAPAGVYCVAATGAVANDKWDK